MLSELFIIKIVSILLVFIVAISAGLYPFFKRWHSGATDFPVGQALASGVFLGAGLIHMLGESNESFTNLGIAYPVAFLIAGITVLVFLGLEHIGNDLSEHKGSSTKGFAVIAVVMLSIHSLFAGAALGLSRELATIFMLVIAILAHKWAASFALATQITQSQLRWNTGFSLFLLFSMMTPIGIYFGTIVSNMLDAHVLIEPVFNAIAAGTFLYLGTLHGLSRSFMIHKCCDLKNFFYVILGFVLMAIVAIWT